MNEEPTYSSIRKLSVSYRSSVLRTRARTLFLKFGTGDLKYLVERLSDAGLLDHAELDKINEQLLRVEGMEPPTQQRSDPERLDKLKRLGGDE